MDVALILSGGSASHVNLDIVCDVETAVMKAALVGAEQMQLGSTVSIYPSWVAVADASTSVSINTTHFYYDYEVPYGSCHSGNTTAAIIAYSRAPNMTSAVAINVSLALYISTGGNVTVGTDMAASVAQGIEDIFSNVTTLASLLRDAKLISDWSSATNSSISNTTLGLASFPIVYGVYQAIAMA